MAQDPKKILIVEDERPLARALELKLKSSGYAPHVVFDGQAALSLLETESFDLILLDLVMPKMDGFSVLKELKNKGNNIPIIVSSNLSQEEDLKKAKELGARDYFIKSNTPLAEIIKHVDKTVKL